MKNTFEIVNTTDENDDLIDNHSNYQFNYQNIKEYILSNYINILILVSALLSFFILLYLIISYKQINSTNKPNVIFILIDDLGYTYLGDDNHNKLINITSNLHYLSKNGIRLSNYYTQEMCTPTRAALLTGRYPISIGMQYDMTPPIGNWGMPLDQILLPKVLKENGYSTHMLGKWHLGHYTPQYLPSARGFDTYLGYLTGKNHYWSKKMPDYPEYQDFLESNQQCYNKYSQIDIHNYSTYLYTDKAIDIINNEINNNNPFFLYLAYQAVHDPFSDVHHFTHGIPNKYLPHDILNIITGLTNNQRRFEQLKTLYLLDVSIGRLVNHLKERNIFDNTYLIISSDNGGCYLNGGLNEPFRGCKSTLFEGGTKIDGLIYSPKKLLSNYVYNGLFHMIDWFPTILSLVGITSYSNDIDGISHSNDLKSLNNNIKHGRDHILYNLFYNVSDMNFNIWVNSSFAVRNERYKLMHGYINDYYSQWINSSYIIPDALSINKQCSQDNSNYGNYTYFLFDLVNDPYERINLYDNISYNEIRYELYDILNIYIAKNIKRKFFQDDLQALETWKSNDYTVVPWIDTIRNDTKTSYPIKC